MFSGCTKIVGGKGTVYDPQHANHQYAHIDGGPEAPGYLTYKAPSNINGISADNAKNAPVYNVFGKKLIAPQKGINIIGGKKVIVK